MLKKVQILLIVLAVVSVIYLISKVDKNNKIRNFLTSNNYKYFDYSEFDTPAVQGVDNSGDIYEKNGKSYVKNSGLKNMDTTFLNMLDKSRDIVEKEYNSVNPNSKIVFRINSGYRSPAYNDWLDNNTTYQVAKTSSHMGGLASDIDVSTYSTEQIKVILDSLVRSGFNRFGLGQNFIHVDNDTGKTQNISWNYGTGSINLDPFNL